jgi:hypothetical protein
MPGEAIRSTKTENYEKAYSTPITPLCADYDLWLGILNVVFALAVQRQEYELE